jgi:hypothetical protein
MNTEDIRAQARSFSSTVESLTFEVERLQAENAALKLQVQQLQSAGAELSPATAKAWQTRFAQFPVWDQLKVGSAAWNAAAGQVEGSGLKALRDELMAVPMTTIERTLWDRAEAKRVEACRARGATDYIPARPAPARKRCQYAISYMLDQKHPGLGKALDQLTKGLQGRLRLVIEIAFLLYGTEAIDRIANDPELVLHHIQEQGRPIDEAADARSWAAFADLLSGRVGREQELVKARNLLGVEPSATAADIKSAYRAKARQHHPDAGGDAAAFAQVAAAYELLTA